MKSASYALLVIVSCGLVGLAQTGVFGALLRSIIAFWFLLVCPGLAFIPLLRLPSRAVEWTLAVALSLALGVLVSEALVLARAWTPEGGLSCLIALSLSGAGLQLVRIGWEARPELGARGGWR